MTYVNSYYDLTRTADQVKKGNHRGLIGGMWDEIGKLQFDYLTSDGLIPSRRLLDVG